MLELKNISITLINSGRPLVEDFSFTLNAGDKAVIIGEEGNGKSTLLKYIYDPDMIDGYCDCGGRVLCKGRAAYLPQMMDESLSALSLAEFFDVDEVYSHMDVLLRLGLTPYFIHSEQRLGTLSGGEKVKVQLARILLDDPDVLLLDEPTNDLDIETLEWLEGFISGSKLPILYVSHDETLIERTANVIIHMEQIIRKTKCRISVTHADYREYLSRRRLALDKQGQVAQKQRDDYDKQMEKWRQIYDRVDHEQHSLTRGDPHGGKMLKRKMKSVLSQEKRFERQSEDFIDFPEEESAILTKFSEDIRVPSGKVVLDLSLSGLSAGGKALTGEVSLFVTGGEHIGITGKNGTGKSTLLKAIWERLRDRRDITACYMPQDYTEKLDYSLTPIDYLAENYSKADVTRARTFMGSMKFTHEEMTSRIGRLSGGQRAKLLFLEMVLKEADVLILDEPTRNFSPLSGPVVRKAIKDFGGAVISVSHDRKYLSEVCDRVYELGEDGLFLRTLG